MHSMRLFSVLGFTVLGVCVPAWLLAQSERMTPNAPVKNFRLPRFTEDGFTQWVLQGQEGIYESEALIRVKGMALRVYSGDERMLKELSLESPEADLLTQENRAESVSALFIEGANFEIHGVGWSWNGGERRVEVKTEARMSFSEDLSDAFMDATVAAEGAKTQVNSERLELAMFPDLYRFTFSEDVRVVSPDMDLRSQYLEVQTDVPKGTQAGAPTRLTGEQVDAVQQIVAKEQVLIEHQGRVIEAQTAEFWPREDLIYLRGEPKVAAGSVYVTGETVTSRAGAFMVEGVPGLRRAQAILAETGGLGLEGASAKGAETIILADTIEMQVEGAAHRFTFTGRVEVSSGELVMSADMMTVLSRGGEVDVIDADSDLSVGAVEWIDAEGNVRIVQGEQVSKSDAAKFYPLEARAVLTGRPNVSNGEASVTGQRIELKQGRALVSGSLEARVLVLLPVIEDLGFNDSNVEASLEDSESEVVAEEASVETDLAMQHTSVQSREVEVLDQGDTMLFTFSDAVEIVGTNLLATCEQMVVHAVERDGGDLTAELATETMQVEKIEAREQVVVIQRGRIATSEEADILVSEGRVELREQVVVEDERGAVRGDLVTLNRGQRRAVVHGGESSGGRAKITLKPREPKADTSGK